MASAVAVVAFGAYLLTLAPGLLANDSGEFQTLAVTLGHTHPTGYPIYLLLAKLATLLPFGTPAFNVNLFSAVMAAAAVAGVYLLGSRLTNRSLLPLAGALALAISPTFWSQSIIAEVYTSGAAFMILILIGLLNWQQSERSRWLFFAAFAGGLSVGVHSTVSLMAPTALLFVLCGPGRRRTRLACALAGAVSGLCAAVAGFAVIDWANPPSNFFQAVVYPSLSEWDMTATSLDSFWERLWFCLTDRQSGYLTSLQSASNSWTAARGFFGNLPAEFPWLWLIAATVGSVRLVRHNRGFGWLLMLTLATHLAVVFRSIMGDIQVLYIPAYVVVAVLGTMGLASAVDFVDQIWRAAAAKKHPFRSEGAALVVAAVALIWPLFLAGAWTNEGRRAVWNPEEGEPEFTVEYSEELHTLLRGFTSELEDNAVVFTEWAWLYPLYYVAHVEQTRTDLVFIQAYPRPRQRELASSALEFMTSAAASRAVYLLIPSRLPPLPGDVRIAPVTRGHLSLYKVQLTASTNQPDH